MQRQLKLKDKVETWSISEMDGRKKKKGTLGVGNGAVFFASESDKVSTKSAATLTIDVSRQTVLDQRARSCFSTIFQEPRVVLFQPNIAIPLR
jgi:hypothetical protein